MTLEGLVGERIDDECAVSVAEEDVLTASMKRSPAPASGRSGRRGRRADGKARTNGDAAPGIHVRARARGVGGARGKVVIRVRQERGASPIYRRGFAGGWPPRTP